MGQMANLFTKRQQGSVPSNSEINSRGEGKEHVKAITLRSGRDLATPGQPPVVREVETEVTYQFSLKYRCKGSNPKRRS